MFLPGRRILFAPLGARLPNGLEIAVRSIGDIESRGMICSEIELGIGHDADGIFVFDDAGAPAPGTAVTEALGLRDRVLELSLTPNRPDCLGHIGIARELAMLFDVPFSLPRAAAPAGCELRTPVRIEVSDPDGCPRYGGQVVHGVRVGRGRCGGANGCTPSARAGS